MLHSWELDWEIPRREGWCACWLYLAVYTSLLFWTAANPWDIPQWSMSPLEAFIGDLWLWEAWLVQISFRGSQMLVQTSLTSYFTTFRKIEAPMVVWAEWRGRLWQWLMPQAFNKGSIFMIKVTLNRSNLYYSFLPNLQCKIYLGSWYSIRGWWVLDSGNFLMWIANMNTISTQWTDIQ